MHFRKCLPVPPVMSSAGFSHGEMSCLVYFAHFAVCFLFKVKKEKWALLQRRPQKVPGWRHSHTETLLSGSLPVVSAMSSLPQLLHHTSLAEETTGSGRGRPDRRAGAGGTCCPRGGGRVYVSVVWIFFKDFIFQLQMTYNIIFISGI